MTVSALAWAVYERTFAALLTCDTFPAERALAKASKAEMRAVGALLAGLPASEKPMAGQDYAIASEMLAGAFTLVPERYSASDRAQWERWAS